MERYERHVKQGQKLSVITSWKTDHAKATVEREIEKERKEGSVDNIG